MVRPVISTYRISRAAFPSDKDNPDWRTPYTYLHGMDDEFIAFEFLRRNLSYWEAYTRVVGLPLNPTKWPRTVPTLFKFGPDPEFEKFGLRAFCDPRQPVALGYGRPWAPEASLRARYIDALKRADAQNNYDYTFRYAALDRMRVDFLINGPIEQQVEFVRWLLNRAKRSLGLNPRNEPRPSRKLKFYLQLLDARSDGASFAKIAAHFYGRQDGAVDRVKKQYKAAARYCEQGYRELLLWEK